MDVLQGAQETWISNCWQLLEPACQAQIFLMLKKKIKEQLTLYIIYSVI